MKLTIRTINKIRVLSICLKDLSSINFLIFAFKVVNQDTLISQGQTNNNFRIFRCYTSRLPSLLFDLPE